MWEILIVLSVFMVLMLLGVPVAVSLGLGAAAGIVLTGVSVTNLPLRMYAGIDIFTILAVPFFLTVGYLATASSLGARTLDLAQILVGRLRGGVGHINVVVSMLFAGISGSATADSAGVGSVLIPMMRKRGYPAPYTAALTATTSVIGSIIPPSIAMVIYGTFAQVSIGALFLGGIVPGIVLGFTFMGWNFYMSRRLGVDVRGVDDPPPPPQADPSANPHQEAAALAVPLNPQGLVAASPLSPSPTGSPPQPARGVMRTVARAAPATLIPILIVGGVSGGAFTATEAGAVALAYTLVLVIAYRDLRAGELAQVFVGAARFCALPVFSASTAAAFGWVMVLLGARDAIHSLVMTTVSSPWLFLVAVVLVLLLVGAFLDSLPTIIIFAPLFVPIGADLGIHPVHLGMVVVLAVGMGLVTPPYGLCLLICSRLADQSAVRVSLAMIPFWILTLAVILAVVFIPQLVTTVPRLLMPGSM